MPADARKLARRVARGPARSLLGAAYRVRAVGRAPHSCLFVVDDNAGWVLVEEGRALRAGAHSLGIHVGSKRWVKGARGQCVFYCDQFALLNGEWRRPLNRLAVAWFHGLPGTGEPSFDECHETVRRHHAQIDRVQVSHRAFEEVVLETGIDPAKVFRIPIGLDLPRFPYRTPQDRLDARRRLGVPLTAFAVGSVMKDGVGWGEGHEPKLIKGPDVLLRALELAAPRIPELFVVLTAPARGYVRAGLERLGIPHVHLPVDSYHEIPGIYAALDACLVASRQEGGPKAVLESMATGVPLVSTRVGQATDLVRHGVSGWLADIGDAEALAGGLVHVHDHAGSLQPLLDAARATAEEEAYDAQLPRWAAFFEGFSESGARGRRR